jgi:DNA-binding transcriptional MerR regulator
MSRKLPASAVAARYGRSSKTLDRWGEQGIIPKPKYINGYKFWDEAELDAADKIREEVGPRFPLMGRQRKAEAVEPQQSQGNSVDPETSAKQRKSENAELCPEREGAAR